MLWQLFRCWSLFVVFVPACLRTGAKRHLWQRRSEGLIAEEGAYRASSCQSGDSMHSTCSSDDGRAHFTDGQEADGVSSTAGSGDKRRRFANKRKDHYDMRSALKE